MEHYIKTKTKYTPYFNHGSPISKGLILLVHPNHKDTQISHQIIIPGQLSKFTLLINQRTYNIIVIYGPSESDDHQFFKTNLFNYNTLPSNDTNIVVGDFNAVQDHHLDCRNYTTQTSPKTTLAINTAKLEHSLVDPYRERHNVSRIFSWKRFNEDKHSRIDYFLISQKLYPFIKKNYIQTHRFLLYNWPQRSTSTHHFFKHKKR